MSDKAPNPEPLMPIVVSLIDKPMDSDQFADALRVAGPAELAERSGEFASMSAHNAQTQEQIRARMAEWSAGHHL